MGEKKAVKQLHAVFSKYVYLLLICLLFVGYSSSAQAADKVSVAVLDLEAKGGITLDEASIITDRLRAKFIQSGRFQVLERSRMEAILKEQGFQQSVFCDDAKCKAKIGRLLGVEGLIIGTVSRLGSVYTLSVRVLDVDRGVIIREEFQDCECPLTHVLTRVTEHLVSRVLGEETIPLSQNAYSSSEVASPMSTAPIQVHSLAGTGWSGFLDGPSHNANFNLPTQLLQGPAGQLLIADAKNHRVRKLSKNGYVSTLAGTNPPLVGQSFADGQGDQVLFNQPRGLALHPSGKIYLVDTDNHRVRIVSASGNVSTLIGTGVAGYLNGNPAVAQFQRPQGIAVNSQGVVYIADTDNHSIRKVSPTGIVSTLAGNGQSGFVNGNGSAARFHFPTALIIDKQGSLYVTDTYNHSIRKVSPSGDVTTLAGDGKEGFMDGASHQSQFRFPRGLALDTEGNLYIADTNNHRIRKLTLEYQVLTIAGNGQAGFADGNAAVAQFNRPQGMLMDEQGSLIVADSGNHRIRKIVFQ